MTKKVHIVALAEAWTGISRLPFALKRVGFSVTALCPKTSFISQTWFLDQKMTYPIFTYTRGKMVYLWILLSLVKFQPDLIIPGDEEALLALQNLANVLQGLPGLSRYAEKIRSSVAPKEFDSVVLSKSRFVSLCSEWGVRVPLNMRVNDLGMALQMVPRFGYPVVLKFDFGYGASGVSICRSEEDLRQAFSKHRKANFSARVKSFVKSLLFVVQKDEENTISLQQYIEGQVGLVPFCAKNGETFATNPMLKHRTYPGPTGPSSVCKGLESPEINKFVQIAAKNLNFTGFGSLDFIIDEKSGLPYVIELNPRPVPTCHFSAELSATDLCEAFYQGLNGQAVSQRSFKPFLIALFPNEKRRDPQSEFFTEGYHDIPHQDPQLMKALENS